MIESMLAIILCLFRFVLGRVVPGLEQLANRPGIRSARYHRALATGAVPKIPGPAVSIRPLPARKARHRLRDSPVNPANGFRQSPLASAGIHGELKMLGITISEQTVSRLLRSVRRPPPSQTWKTFLRNHFGQIVSVDFFTVPTIRLRVLFVFLVIEHRRR
jgi:hypothetical protein